LRPLSTYIYLTTVIVIVTVQSLPLNNILLAHHICLFTKYLLLFRPGEVCSHVAALLLKVDIAVKKLKMGLTKSFTGEACKWNASFCRQLELLSLQDMIEEVLLLGNHKVHSLLPIHLDELHCHLLRFQILFMMFAQMLPFYLYTKV